MALPATITREQLKPICLPDVRRLEQMPSWPAWVASRIASLKTESQPDQTTGRWRLAPTLPVDLILSVVERDELERHAGALNVLCKQTPRNSPEAERNMLLAVTKMMLVLPTTPQNEVSAEVRGEAFMAALEDNPVWAVQAAIRRWYRGKCGNREDGKPYDYHWSPAPAELRRISFSEMYRVKERVDTIEALLRAQPRIEFSDEHCRAMRERLVKLYSGFGIPPVGKDGSGGEVSAS